MTSGQKNPEGHLVYYLRKFGWFKGAISGIISTFPILANLTGLESKGVIPPMGFDYLALYVLLLILVIFAAYSLRYSFFFRDHIWISTLIVFLFLILGTLSFLGYVNWQKRAVRCGEVKPEKDKPSIYCVIIGLQRSEFAEKAFKDWTDEKILKKRGWTDEQVRKLWKPESIDKARIRVIGYYLLVPLLVVGALGVLVVRECIDEGWS